jgi:ubiquinone/menaquinone biosynthesis C-methylase UbiE
MASTQQDITAGFQNVEQSDADFLIKFLEDANRLPSIVESFQTQLKLLDLKPGERVLDVGCGIGDRAAQMAEIVGPSGKVVGTDLSPVMVEASEKRHGDRGLPVEFHVANACEQPFSDASFDCIRTERVLMYLEDPTLAIREFRRLLKDGGRLVVADFDWDALLFAHQNKALTRRIVEFISDSFPSGRVGADLFGIFHRFGFKDVVFKPFAYFCPLEFTKRVCGGIVQTGVDKGVFNQTDVADWWAALEQDEKGGTYFMAYQGFNVAGTK